MGLTHSFAPDEAENVPARTPGAPSNFLDNVTSESWITCSESTLSRIPRTLSEKILDNVHGILDNVHGMLDNGHVIARYRTFYQDKARKGGAQGPGRHIIRDSKVLI